MPAPRAPYTLVLLRHGESEWNAKNLFTGWVDVALTDKGRERGRARRRADGRRRRAARRAAHLGAAARDHHRAARARRRATGTGSRCGAPGGSTSGTTAPCRARTRRRRWRSSARSSSCSGAAPTTPRRRDRRRRRVVAGRRRRATPTSPTSCVPRTECLKDVVERMLPYWYDAIVPDLRAGRTVLVAAHGNSLRGAGEAPRRHVGGGRRRAQHPHRHPAGLPPRRGPAPDRARRASTSTPTPPPTPSRPSPTRAADRWPPHVTRGYGLMSGLWRASTVHSPAPPDFPQASRAQASGAIRGSGGSGPRRRRGRGRAGRGAPLPQHLEDQGGRALDAVDAGALPDA